jgi:hypothetical protein
MKDFHMPEAKLGDRVLFYAHEGAEPAMAFVTGVSKRTLNLWVIAPGYGGTERQSVHHLKDEGVLEFPDWKEYGFWEHRPADPKIAILSEKVALLEKRLESPKAK